MPFIFLIVFMVPFFLFGMEELTPWHDFESTQFTSPTAENPEESLQSITKLSKNNNFPQTLQSQHFPQWVEIALQEGTPVDYKAAGKTIAWTTAENPQKCYNS